MVKSMFIAISVLAIAAPALVARSWTDKNGRKIEADIVSADDTRVTILMNGKEFEVSLATLSDADQEFVKEWLEKKDDDGAGETVAPSGATGEPTFDGKPLKLGGKTNLYEFDYSPEKLKEVQKHKGRDTGFKIALAVPADFDPSKPQKVFICCTAVNNAKQGADGNVYMMRFFAKECVKNGWVCMAYDTNIGRTNYDNDLTAACEKLKQCWPQFKEWKFAVGGFSGGAKACFYPCAYLLKNDYKVIGAFLAGCNEDFSGKGRDVYRVGKSAYKDVKVFLGNPTYKAEYAEPVAKSLKKNGMSNVRSEVHNGKNSLDYAQFGGALKWFSE